jgi:DNA anti-recombination protein RmuC
MQEIFLYRIYRYKGKGKKTLFFFRLKKEMVMRVNQVAAEFRKVSNKQMAETTKRTIRENVSINAQLTKMSDKTMELIQENDELKQNEKKQRQQIEMLEVNEKDLAKKNHSNQKVRCPSVFGRSRFISWQSCYLFLCDT